MNVHYRNLPDDDSDRIPKFFFNGINLTVWENDIAILKIADQEGPVCILIIMEEYFHSDKIIHNHSSLRRFVYKQEASSSTLQQSKQ